MLFVGMAKQYAIVLGEIASQFAEIPRRDVSIRDCGMTMDCQYPAFAEDRLSGQSL